MKLFSHTFENYSCPRCHHGQQMVAPNLHGFFAIWVAVASVAFQIRELFSEDPLGWYYFISIFAGQLLLLWIAGHLASVFLVPFQKIRSPCPGCGSQDKPFFAGRYFETSEKAHWTDWSVLGAFLAANVALWCIL